eukprot:tig00000254_g22479.t1
MKAVRKLRGKQNDVSKSTPELAPLSRNLQVLASVSSASSLPDVPPSFGQLKSIKSSVIAAELANDEVEAILNAPHRTSHGPSRALASARPAAVPEGPGGGSSGEEEEEDGYNRRVEELRQQILSIRPPGDMALLRLARRHRRVAQGALRSPLPDDDPREDEWTAGFERASDAFAARLGGSVDELEKASVFVSPRTAAETLRQSDLYRMAALDLIPASQPGKAAAAAPAAAPPQRSPGAARGADGSVTARRAAGGALTSRGPAAAASSSSSGAMTARGASPPPPSAAPPAAPGAPEKPWAPEPPAELGFRREACVEALVRLLFAEGVPGEGGLPLRDFETEPVDEEAELARESQQTSLLDLLDPSAPPEGAGGSPARRGPPAASSAIDEAGPTFKHFYLAVYRMLVAWEANVREAAARPSTVPIQPLTWLRAYLFAHSAELESVALREWPPLAPLPEAARTLAAFTLQRVAGERADRDLAVARTRYVAGRAALAAAHVPPRAPGAWAPVRIYVASTPDDMAAERSLIRHVVAPELEKLCAKRRVYPVFVDLRYGLSGSAALDEGSVATLLEEVERCRPFFVCFAGQRAGELIDMLSLPSGDYFAWAVDFAGRSLLELESALAAATGPPWTFKLPPAPPPKEERRGRIHKAAERPAPHARRASSPGPDASPELAGAAGPAGGAPPPPPQPLPPLNGILAGGGRPRALAAPRPPDTFALAYLRDPKILKGMAEGSEAAMLYGAGHAEEARRAEAAREHLRRHCFVFANYPARWSGPAGAAGGGGHVVGLEALAGRLVDDLWRCVSKHDGGGGAGPRAPRPAGAGGAGAAAAEEDPLGLAEFAAWDAAESHPGVRFLNYYQTAELEARARSFAGRAELTAALLALATAPGPAPPAVLVGEPGSGRASLLARLVTAFRRAALEAPAAAAAAGPAALASPSASPGTQRGGLTHRGFPGDDPPFAVHHFVSASLGAGDARRAVHRLCRQIALRYDLIDRMAVPEDAEELAHFFPSLLDTVSRRGGQLLVAIADADRIHTSFHMSDLRWLPVCLPPGVKVIVSMAEGPALEALRARAPYCPPAELRCGPLGASAEERTAVLQRCMDRQEPGARLSEVHGDYQVDVVLAKPEAWRPGYLDAAAAEARLLAGHEPSERLGNLDQASPQDEPFPGTLAELLERGLDRLEDAASAGPPGHLAEGMRSGPELAREAALLIALSRGGLLEPELLELLRPVAPLTWARLLRPLEFYLRPPALREDGALAFASESARRAVLERYLGPRPDDARRAVYRKLARYYFGKADPAGLDEWTGPPRALRDAVWYAVRAGMWASVGRALCSLRYIERRAADGATDDLVAVDFVSALATLREQWPALRARLGGPYRVRLQQRQRPAGAPGEAAAPPPSLGLIHPDSVASMSESDAPPPPPPARGRAPQRRASIADGGAAAQSRAGGLAGLVPSGSAHASRAGSAAGAGARPPGLGALDLGPSRGPATTRRARRRPREPPLPDPRGTPSAPSALPTGRSDGGGGGGGLPAARESGALSPSPEARRRSLQPAASSSQPQPQSQPQWHSLPARRALAMPESVTRRQSVIASGPPRFRTPSPGPGDAPAPRRVIGPEEPPPPRSPSPAASGKKRLGVTLPGEPSSPSPAAAPPPARPQVPSSLQRMVARGAAADDEEEDRHDEAAEAVKRRRLLNSRIADEARPRPRPPPPPAPATVSSSSRVRLEFVSSA